MENFKKKVKEIWTKVKTKAVEIFKIVKEWVIAHKVASIVIASVLAVAIILAIVLPIALRDKECEHTWADATCTAPKTCTECDATEGEALGHTWKDATCTAPKTCSVCAATEGAALDHTWNEGTVKTPATCTEAGDMEYACTVEGCEGKKEEAIPAAHAWNEGEVTTAPTCEADGVKTFTCTVDGCEGTKTEAIPAAHTWNEGEVTTEATCTTDGVKTFTCTVEGCEGKMEEAIPAAHAWNDATCEAAKTCSVCGATEGEANGHDWANATCEAAKTCSVCGATEGEANGHDWANATCEAAKTCSVCGATEGEANGHAFDATKQIVVVEGVAYTVEDCANCDATQNVAIENAVVVTDPAALTIESGKTYVLTGEAAYDITLAGELSNVTIVGGKATCIKVDANAVIDGLTIKDVELTAGDVAQMYLIDAKAGSVKNLVVDGCTFNGTENCISNAIQICGVENVTVTNCTFKNLDWNTLPIFINKENVGTVVISNNTVDNFAQRFVRIVGVTEGTITISGNTLTNWMYIEGKDTNDAEIIKASTTTATIVIGEGNTLDGEAIGELVTEDDGDQVVYADKTNEEETPDYVAPEGGAQE